MDGALQSKGWSQAKIAAFRESLLQFLDNAYIDSKDTGAHTCLGKSLFLAQWMILDALFEGLAEGIHDYYILKSRQLGSSTLVRAICVFWLGVHDGLRAALVFDTDKNRNNARRELESMIDNLPSSIKFPRIKSRNRDSLTLENGSSIEFMAAGVKKNRSSGVLGRSSGLSMAHCSEMCSWDNDEGVVSFRQALSDINPNRLYIWESTARGYNIWKEIWDDARKDPHAKCVFLGWWAKQSQKIDIRDADFLKYGEPHPTEEEIERIALVKEKYGVEIGPEQLAWVRKRLNTLDDDPNEEGGSDPYKIQEQPWCEEDAFQMTGATFFASEVLQDMANKHASNKYKSYSYSGGDEFVDMRVWPAANKRSVQLKVWEEPENSNGVYIVSADPAFGTSEFNDRSGAQVLRCYADGLDQVAEYAWPMINTLQFAWVLASLMGWYGQSNNEVYFILEINGPGDAVLKELQHLKRHIEGGYQPTQVETQGLQNVFRNVRNYFWTKTDALAPTRNLHMLTQERTKISMMERLNDFVTNGMIHVRSMETLEEMRWVQREGDRIEAQGSKKDDRVMALALGVRMWEDRVRRMMVPQRRTREVEMARKSFTIRDQVALFNKNHLDSFFAVKKMVRDRATLAEKRALWRSQPSRMPSWRSRSR